ncbi:hypothetical protein Bca52824_027910 [Brassica carinata]|uniref:AB hydrolase-1 domain-containing protein n=1 Tax=Brassica carinata TaxID=52824 RepID=A0A8X7VBB2_BRACI|nr:hypothetical protein Bca52824_027910 [Brassica carinata]
MENQKRFVLVHGICHGAWSWYKVKTHLEAAGHCVTAVDLAASGINMTKVEEIQTLKDYTKPLLDIMDSLASEEKVVPVAHSMGAAFVFLTSVMPDTKIPPAYVVVKLVASIPPEEFVDTVFGCYGAPDLPLETSLLGPRFLTKKCYQLSPVEDLELAKMLVRVNPIVTINLAEQEALVRKGTFHQKK